MARKADGLTPEQSASSNAPKKQIGRPIQPGQVLNPAGRPKGSRNKLGEAFIAALHDDFQEHGPATIAKVRETDPTAYVKVCASLLPKEVKLTGGVEDLTDEQLDARIRVLAAAISLEIGGEAGTGEPSRGAETAH